jgi:uncharacterized protein (TIGR03086 family)
VGIVSDYDKTGPTSARTVITMDTATHYRTLAERMATVIEAAAPARWNDPSPCAGWSATDVVDHVVSTQRDFLTRHDLDPGPARDVAADPPTAWRAHAEQVTGLLAQPGVAAQRFDGYFGPTTVGDTIAQFYGFDMIVHRWDVARATGITTTFTPDELEQIVASIDGFGEHLYADGVCGPPVDVDASAPRQDRLLARMGRDPR